VININLLPPEYRKAESTPIARFIAIVAGAVLVTTGLVVYGFVHYSKLKGVREVRVATEEEYANKKARADTSKALQAEITAYQSRRQAIQEIAKSRIMHSRKLDEFLDIVHNRNDRSTYFVWLKSFKVTAPRQVRRGQPTSGGTMAFAGWAKSTEFSRVTKFRDAIRQDPFFEDFSSISQPNFVEVQFGDDLEPSSAGQFGFELVLKPLGWQHGNK